MACGGFLWPINGIWSMLWCLAPVKEAFQVRERSIRKGFKFWCNSYICGKQIVPHAASKAAAWLEPRVQGAHQKWARGRPYHGDALVPLVLVYGAGGAGRDGDEWMDMGTHSDPLTSCVWDVQVHLHVEFFQ